MNAHEFSDWFSFHSVRFTGVGSWLAKFPDEKPRSEAEPITKRAILKAWRGILADVSLDAATQASEALANGDESFSERGFDCHPRDVRRVAIGIRRSSGGSDRTQRYIGGERTYACPECLDTGAIVVALAKSLRAARDGDLFHKDHNPTGETPLYSGTAACSCEAGQQFAGWGCARFDEERMLRLDSVERGNWWEAASEFAAASTKGVEFNPEDWQ